MSSDKPDVVAEEALRLVRLSRLAHELKLDRALIESLRKQILVELGELAVESKQTFDSQDLIDSKSEESKQDIKPAKPARTSEINQRIVQIEMRLRRATTEDEEWRVIEPLALELYRLKPHQTTAARVIELAFLHHGFEFIEKNLARFRKEQPQFWHLVHRAVRSGIVVRFWSAQGSESLSAILFKEKDETYLEPIERLSIFWTLKNARDKSAALIYYRKFASELSKAVVSVGENLGIYPSRYFLEVGKIAADLGGAEEAQEALEQVNSNDPERDEALRLLLELGVERNRTGRSHYMEILLAAKSDLERVQLLEKFLNATRGLGGFRDRNRPALNEILGDPLSWVQEDPQVWRSLSIALASARDLEGLLPNLYAVFRKNANHYFSPLLDAALWQGPLSCDTEDARDLFWRGVGLLHHYINCGVSQEEVLWEARDRVLLAKKFTKRPLPYEWRDLHKAAFTWIAKNHYVIESDREAMLRQMRIAVESQNCLKHDIEDYLQHTDKVPSIILSTLQSHLKEKQDPILEHRLILKRAQNSHLTNFDLNRLWQLANQRKETDLPWRIATILQTRMSLIPQVRSAWEISGEKRSQYPLIQIPKASLDILLDGFEPKLARLCYASQEVGWALPELLFLLDEGASVVRSFGVHGDRPEMNIDAALNGLGWLGLQKRRYRFSFEAAPLGNHIPQFIQILPSNPWSYLVAALSERLGVNSWGWKLSRLHQQVENLIPRIASRQDLGRRSGKVADWLKHLTPEQRTAWQDLAGLSRTVDDDRAVFALAAFVCRFATSMYQNHSMALHSLQTMRAPVEIIWDLEQFIVSNSYGALRKSLGTINRIPVPNALQRISSIFNSTT